jgi:translocation and assembly module TamB
MPIALDVARLRVGELHAGPLGEKPIRDLQARVQLGAERGKLHRVDALALGWDRLAASGAARIASDAPFELNTQLQLTQQASSDMAAWRASATLKGPLVQPLLDATVRAQPTANRPEQSLDLHASLRPFEAWPLGTLQATTKALDLSAFHSSAPLTALSGEASAQTRGIDQPANVTARLANAEAGRWNEGRLPLRELTVDLQVRPGQPHNVELKSVEAVVGTQQQSAGRVQGKGSWTPQQWKLDASVQSLQPSLLNARAPAMVFSGPILLAGKGFDGPIEAATVDAKVDLSGEFSAGRGPVRSARLTLDGTASAQRIELRDARAVTGGAQASLGGVAARDRIGAPWHVKGRGTLADFDPAPWWPGREDSPWRKGPNRLNGSVEADLVLPRSSGETPLFERIVAVRGRVDASIANSVLAGVPLHGETTLRSTDGASVLASLKLDAAGNTVNADGRLNARRDGAEDQWELSIAAPALKQLAPLWRLGAAAAGEGALAGSMTANAQVNGRWPAISTRGQVEANGLRVGQTGVEHAQAQWQVDTSSNAAVDVQATLQQMTFSQALFKGTPPIESARLQLKGTMRDHRLEVQAETRARPPAWTDNFQATSAAPPVAPASSAGATASAALAHTLAVLSVQGGAIEAAATKNAAAHWSGWRGTVQRLELGSTASAASPWVRTRDVGMEVQWADGPTRLTVQPGSAELLSAKLRWDRIAWQAASGAQAAQVEAQAELDPLSLAPLLARAQPDFGWGGDLAVVGHLKLSSAPSFHADVVLERQRGDLTVTDEAGNTQALGLTDLRLGLNVDSGVWSFTQGLAGKTLGVAAGAVVARTSPQATWPPPDAPIQGVLEVQVANLGTWGPWVPAGWRLTGALRTSASIGGRFGAPEYTGEMRGSGLGVRNFLEGVNVSDGDVAIALQGTTARIDHFTARAGNGSVKLDGNATLGESPKALLKLQAEKFQLLGRVDRRIVTSGQAELQLDRDTLALDGKFAIDEGLIDFSRSDAPKLSSDVEVIRSKQTEPVDIAVSTPLATPTNGHTMKLDLQVSLGDRLRLRGRGIDTGLRGDLRITSPGGRLAVNGTVQAVDGTYDAYGQKLAIERGLITFNGPLENPRLDIEATRPNTDVRVGVQVSGTALNPRVRLFSEPELSEIDKLSWLVLGRASDGLGRTDTALLQRAALALLAGEGEGVTDKLTKAIGLDEVSLRQTEGEVKETVVSLGKQLSRRWYVGYERSLNATTGTWQLIYRVAQRFTLRAQSGLDNSLDVIWTWRWQ